MNTPMVPVCPYHDCTATDLVEVAGTRYFRCQGCGRISLGGQREAPADQPAEAVAAQDDEARGFASPLPRLQEQLLTGNDDPRIVADYVRLLGDAAARLTPADRQKLQYFFMRSLPDWESQATELFESCFRAQGDVVWTKVPAAGRDALARLIGLLVPDEYDPDRLVLWRRGLDIDQFDPRVRVVMQLIQLGRQWPAVWIASTRECLSAIAQVDSDLVRLKHSWKEFCLLKQSLTPRELLHKYGHYVARHELDDYLRQTHRDRAAGLDNDQRDACLDVFCRLLAIDANLSHPAVRDIMAAGSPQADFVWRSFCDSFNESFKALTLDYLRRHHRGENCPPGARCDRRLGAIYAVAEMGRRQSSLLDHLFVHAQRVDGWTARDLLQLWTSLWNDDFAEREGQEDQRQLSAEDDIPAPARETTNAEEKTTQGLTAELLRQEQLLLQGAADPQVPANYAATARRICERLTPPSRQELKRFFLQPMPHWESQASRLFRTCFQELGDAVWTKTPAGFADTLARLIALLVADKNDPDRLVQWRRRRNIAKYNPRVRVVMDLIQLGRQYRAEWIASAGNCIGAFAEAESDLAGLKHFWNEIRLLRQPLNPSELVDKYGFNVPRYEIDDYLQQTHQDRYAGIPDRQRDLYLFLFCRLVAIDTTRRQPAVQDIISQGSPHAEFVWRSFCDTFNENFKALTIDFLRRCHDRENRVPGARCDRRLGAIYAVAEMAPQQSRLLDQLFTHAQQVDGWTAADLLKLWTCIWNGDFADREGRREDERQRPAKKAVPVRPPTALKPRDLVPKAPPPAPPIATAQIEKYPAPVRGPPSGENPPLTAGADGRSLPVARLPVRKLQQHAGIPNWLFWLVVVTGILVFCLVAYMLFDSLL